MAVRNVSPLSRPAAARPLADLRALADFEPTAAQRNFVQLAVAGDAPMRVAAVCQRLGIARSTYYRWLADPGFCGWMALQWSMALLADGGRLLSIARARAESDYRYFKCLMELIFDPRGLGLLATWQQRMAGGMAEAEAEESGDPVETPAAPAPLFPAGDSIVDELEAGESGAEACEKERAAPVEPAVQEPGEDATVAPDPPHASTESTTYAAGAQHFEAPDPSPYIPRYTPPWPNSGGRFHG